MSVPVPPLALMVALPFEPLLQETFVVEVTETVKLGETFTVTVPLLEQPLASVPVTVYVVFETGETVTVVPLKLPGIHA